MSKKRYGVGHLAKVMVLGSKDDLSMAMERWRGNYKQAGQLEGGRLKKLWHGLVRLGHCSRGELWDGVHEAFMWAVDGKGTQARRGKLLIVVEAVRAEVEQEGDPWKKSLVRFAKMCGSSGSMWSMEMVESFAKTPKERLRLMGAASRMAKSHCKNDFTVEADLRRRSLIEEIKINAALIAAGLSDPKSSPQPRL